jgi:hypothetical protein
MSLKVCCGFVVEQKAGPPRSCRQNAPTAPGSSSPLDHLMPAGPWNLEARLPEDLAPPPHMRASAVDRHRLLRRIVRFRVTAVGDGHP